MKHRTYRDGVLVEEFDLPDPEPTTVVVEVDPAQLTALHDRLSPTTGGTTGVLRDLIATLTPGSST